MRSPSFALSLAALGMSAFALVVTIGRSSEPRAGDASIETRLAAVELAVAAQNAPTSTAPRTISREGAELLGVDPSDTGPRRTPGAGEAALAAGARPASPVELDRRLADVEKRLREREARDATAGQLADATVAMNPTFISTADEAEKHLDLSASQKAEFQRALEDAKREIDGIRKTADETGMTWERAEKETLSYQNGAISIDGTKLAAFREKVMPGRSESFGGAMRRVREEAFRRMKSTLSPEQSEKFSKASTDGMLPGASDPFGLISFSMVAPEPIVAPAPEPAMEPK